MLDRLSADKVWSSVSYRLFAPVLAAALNEVGSVLLTASQLLTTPFLTALDNVVLASINISVRSNVQRIVAEKLHGKVWPPALQDTRGEVAWTLRQEVRRKVEVPLDAMHVVLRDSVKAAAGLEVGCRWADPVTMALLSSVHGTVRDSVWQSATPSPMPGALSSVSNGLIASVQSNVHFKVSSEAYSYVHLAVLFPTTATDEVRDKIWTSTQAAVNRKVSEVDFIVDDAIHAITEEG
jgi:hypothetical protein